ncbi:ABC transporter permease [Halorussus limi]|uniref:ABC transporter permease n=1 Tax=Halorussus limi TaxID=2938695 RepID=A0A8U0HYG0_9EURY|nr:ABC transporter permease [Halorussus limi]UPV75741.1 ABC transporter permease [Halorussus limi]
MSTETDEATAGPTIAPGETGGGERGFRTDVWVNFKRWNLKAVRNPFVLTASLVQPIVFLVLFTQVFGQVASGAISRGGPAVTYESFLLPAIVIQVSLVAAATSGIGLVNDIEEGMFEKVLVSPMNRAAVFLGKTLAEMLRITVQILIILGLGVLLGANIETGVAGALAIVVIGIVFAGWFTAFSNVVALVTRDQESTIIGANILQFPLLFVSSAFLPVELLPEWIQLISDFNPVTYGVDAARTLVIDGWIWETILPNVGVLVGLDLVLGAFAVYMLNRASSSEVE